eukprot:TRINITY_DN5966_c3_g1_i1.p1 TRINITY_DN5966_c3_g1~~TRINITY_DN5966_c3_g1_i1.p1  ORF type:complete len:698 (+),score=109.56 TRINITY_DN5966_c3_g1_i1:191-2095(+)
MCISSVVDSCLRAAAEYGSPDGREQRLKEMKEAWSAMAVGEKAIGYDRVEAFMVKLREIGGERWKWSMEQKGALVAFKNVRGGVPLEVFGRILEDPNYTAVQFKPKRGSEVWISVGNTSTQKAEGDYEWTVYAQPEKDFVKKVVFTLHETFSPNVIEVTSPPFSLTRRGWGSFDVNVEVHHKTGQTNTFTHHLTLDRRSEQTSVISVEGDGSMSVLPSHAQWLTKGGSGDLITKSSEGSANKDFKLHTVDWSSPKERRCVQLVEALKRDGFVYITNHQVRPNLMCGIFDVSKTFFQTLTLANAARLTALERNHFHQPPMKCARGYTPMQQEALNPFLGGDLKESFDHGASSDCYSDSQLGINRWPSPEMNPLFKHTCEEYLYDTRLLAGDILCDIEKGLGLDEGVLMEAFESPMVINRLLRYGPQSVSKEDAMGAGSHVDYGALTLITQDSDGLEVLVGDKWIEVPTVPNSFVLNTGYVLEKLTNGVIPATKHRVINKNEGSRLSVATFFDPNPKTFVTPLPAFVKPGEESKYPPCIAGHKGVVVSLQQSKKKQETPVPPGFPQIPVTDPVSMHYAPDHPMFTHNFVNPNHPVHQPPVPSAHSIPGAYPYPFPPQPQPPTHNAHYHHNLLPPHY